MIFLFSFVMHVYAKDCDKVHWKIARLLLLTHDTKDAIKLSWLFTSYWCFFLGGEGRSGWEGIPLSENCPYSEFFRSVFSPKVGKYRPENLRIQTLFTQCHWKKKKKMKVIIVIIIIMTIIANEVFRQDCFSKHEKTHKALRFFYIF